MDFKPGDMFVYEPNDATGVLIESFERAGESWWLYSLRSPKREDLTFHIVKLKESRTSQFRDALQKGDLIHHGAR